MPDKLCAEDLKTRLARVRGRINEAASKAGRSPDGVTLVAVSKFHPAKAVAELAGLGQTIFGESYVQEALPKQDELAHLELSWHLIGGLQKNKAKYAAGRFSLIHSLDNLDLARSLQNQAQALEIVQDVLLQVNLAAEPQKSGAAKADAPGLAEAVARMPNLRLRGLMVLPPYDPDPELSRPYFAGLRELGSRLAQSLGLELPELSMGMSGDLEIAVQEGATLVRVGTDIFGGRP